MLCYILWINLDKLEWIGSADNVNLLIYTDHCNILLKIIISKDTKMKSITRLSQCLFSFQFLTKITNIKSIAIMHFKFLFNYFPWRRFPSYGPLPIEAFNLRKPGASPYLPKPDHHDGNWAYRGAWAFASGSGIAIGNPNAPANNRMMTLNIMNVSLKDWLLKKT